MLVKQRIVKKKEVSFVKESDTISQVLGQLNDNGFRCIPILDDNGEKFVGNIYKVEVLEYKLKDGDMKQPVKNLGIESDAFVHENSSFFEVFHSIKQLPYLAVVDTKGNFSGILPHSKVFELLEEAWGYRTGSCAVTIALPDTDGILIKVLTAVKKVWPLHCVFSLDDDTTYLRRVIITLTKGAKQSTVNELEQAITKQGARIIDIEVFDKENF
ncbi:cyclic di-AMP binding protein CbpA [Solibacillus sp. MA9]|uniref:Cyclic di-AMP binding protein CbpA n=1 Tax=Solibacillus palustris TaxID=2908203 RepID=A0ABS9UB63_9BACL|nr:cyclic di-AMP binding protein CbpA [Solibacillus sp. MA9]MCH7321588.1 cyclic di-AMP binding protein CbpA [Solibacillus sp. MA9]